MRPVCFAIRLAIRPLAIRIAIFLPLPIRLAIFLLAIFLAAL